MSKEIVEMLKWDAYHRQRRQLGTAAWMPNSRLKPYAIGDIWLGKTDSGELAGVRDDRHVLTCFGSRAGKGVSFIIPNLAFWPGSAVVIDPKGENAIVTARRRGNGSAWAQGLGQKVHILDPFDIVKTPVDDFKDLKSSYNPLDAIRIDDPEAVAIAHRLADSLVVSEHTNDPFFDEAAKEYISDVMLHVASAPSIPAHERNLLTVRRLLVAGDDTRAWIKALRHEKKPLSGYALLFAAMQRNSAFDGVVSRAGARLGDLEENSPRLFGSIAQVARTNTHFLDGPNMRKVLETSTVSLESLKRSAKGETLYLCLPQRYMDTHYRWLRMMVTLTVTAAERDPYQPRSGHPVLMMLDEFPALKRMRVLENAAAQIAGYGVKLSFVVQTLAQLKDLYKDNWETFVANSGIKLFSCNDDHFTRDYVSKLIGDEDVVLSTATGSKSEGRSESYGYGSSSTSSGGTSWSSGSNGQPVVSTNSGWSHTSTHNRTYGRSSTETHGYSSSIHKRPLLAPDEVGRAFGNRNNPKALVLLSGHQPVAVHRTLYYREPVMAGYYGWHPNHARPATIAAIHAQRDLEARKQAEADASEAAALKRQRDERERRRLKEENEKKREELRENRKDLIYTVVMAAMTFVLVVRMIHDKFFQ